MSFLFFFFDFLGVVMEGDEREREEMGSEKGARRLLVRNTLVVRRLGRLGEGCRRRVDWNDELSRNYGEVCNDNICVEDDHDGGRGLDTQLVVGCTMT